MLWSLVLASATYAGTVVIHDGSDANGAVNAAVRTSGLSRAEIRAATVPDLLAAAADPLVLGAKVERCERSATSSEELEQVYARVREHMSYVEYPQAMRAIDQAIALHLCSNQLVDWETLAELFYKRGVAGYKIEGKENVRRYFELALALAPDLAWNRKYKEEHGEELFEEVRAPATPPAMTTLTTLSGAHSPQLWMDGALRPTLYEPIGAGAHLIQVVEGDRHTTLILDVEEARPVVVLMVASANEESVVWAFEPATSRPSALALSSVVPRGDTLVALHGRQMGTLPSGEDEWTIRRTTFVPRSLGVSLMGSGAAVGVASVIGMSLAAAEGQRAAIAAGAEERLEERWYEEKASFARAEAWHRLFFATSVLGGVSFAGGVVFTVAGRGPAIASGAEP